MRLAPLYDIASALPYGEDEKKLRFAMRIGSEYRVFPERDPLPRAAADLGLDPERVRERIVALAARAPDAFAEAAAAPQVAELARALPGRLVDLVADRARRCAAVLDQPRPEEPQRRPGTT